MALIFDTHALYWLATGHPKLSRKVVAALEMEGLSLHISAVTAWEYSDLVARVRLPEAPSLSEIIQDYAFTLLDFPAHAWTLASLLPDIHRDPVDRMLIAHAIVADVTLVSGDTAVPKYPVKWLW